MALAKSHKTYFIHSNERIEGSCNNFTYEIQIPAEQHFDHVVLLSACIPNTFYLVQEGYDTFILREGGVDTTITVPPGNYGVTVFSKVLSELLTNNSPNGWIYSMSLPNKAIEANTGKFTYTVSGNDSQPSIVCASNVNMLLGFAEHSTNTFNSNTLVSTATLNFAAEDLIIINSDITGESGVLAVVYSNNTPSLGYITYNCQHPELYSKPLHTKLSSVFRFSITNERKQPLNLHGVDMMLTIALYRKDDVNEIIKKYIEYKIET
jgi:hypothetical protein